MSETINKTNTQGINIRKEKRNDEKLDILRKILYFVGPFWIVLSCALYVVHSLGYINFWNMQWAVFLSMIGGVLATVIGVIIGSDV